MQRPTKKNDEENSRAAGRPAPETGEPAAPAGDLHAPAGTGSPPPGGAGDPPASSSEPVVAVPRAEYEELQAKAGERDLYRDQLLRTRADFDNYQKRVQRDRPQIAEQAVRRLIVDLLPILDNFERALGEKDASADSIRSGIRIVKDMLAKVLADHGVEEIDALGKPFDPSLHDAVVHEDSSAHAPETVSEVLQKGYTHRGTVVRASHVKVARTPEEARASNTAPPGPGPGKK